MIVQNKSRSLGVFILLTLLFLMSCHRVIAHAIVVRAEPVDGAVMATSPKTVTLWLSEAAVPRFNTAELVDERNHSLEGVSVESDPVDHTILHVTLPSLMPGAYTLFWKVLSDVDGHFSQGFVTLNIGQNDGASRPTIPAETGFGTPLESTLRWANYLMLVSLIGALSMLAVAIRSPQSLNSTAAAKAQLFLRRLLWRGAAGCAVGAFLVGLALLAWQVTAAQDLLAEGIGWPTQLWAVIWSGQWGMLWLVRQGLLLFLSVALWHRARLAQEPTKNWLWLLLYGRVVDLAVIQALTGHSGSSRHDWLLALLNTTVHLVAAGVWVGGLLTVGVVVWARRRQKLSEGVDWEPIDWPAFSLAAVVSVGCLIITGLYSTGRQVASVDALLTTAYGQVLFGKGLLVLMVGILGLGNALLVHPRLAVWLEQRVGRPNAARLARSGNAPRLIWAEVLGGILILAAAAQLTASAPPRGVEYTIAPEEIKPVLGQRIDDLIINLEAKPNRLGQNLFNIRTVSTAATPAKVARVSLSFQFPGDTREPVAVIAEEVETNLYQISGDYLRQAGPWQIVVTVQRYDVPNTVAHFRWIAPPSGELQPVILSKASWTSALTTLAAALLVLLVLALVLLLLFLHRRRHGLRQRASARVSLAGYTESIDSEVVVQ